MTFLNFSRLNNLAISQNKRKKQEENLTLSAKIACRKKECPAPSQMLVCGVVLSKEWQVLMRSKQKVDRLVEN